jgi:hypothetical protein
VETETATPTALTKALVTLLRPLVRLLIAQGVTYPYMTVLLKRLFVEVADRDFRLEAKAQTVSRVSVISGVHRKDVRRLLDEPADGAAVPKAVSLGARLITTWLADPEFHDKDGRPAPLSRSGAAGEGPSFEALVQRVHKQDVRPRAVLDELLRVGTVRVDEERMVHLDTQAFVPRDDVDELAYYFGRNLRDHIAAGAHNLAETSDRLPERALYYDKLSGESVLELRDASRELGMDLLREMNSRAAELARRDEGRPDATQRMTLGFYYYAGPDEEDSDPDSGSDKKA